MKRYQAIYISLLMIGTAIVTWDVYVFWVQYFYLYSDRIMFEVRTSYTLLALLGVASVVACLRPGKIQRFLGVLFLGAVVGISITRLLSQCLVEPQHVDAWHSTKEYGKLILLALVGIFGAYIHSRMTDDHPVETTSNIGRLFVSWKALIIVLFLLSMSTCVNVWFAGTLRVYQYNYHHGWFTRSLRGPEYPIDGLTSFDLKTMLDLIDKVENDDENRRILSVDVLDSNRVKITTGRVTGNLGGTGSTFLFIRSGKEWKIDQQGFWEAENITEPKGPGYSSQARRT